MHLILKYRLSIIWLFISVTISILVGTLFPAEKMAQINVLAYDKLAHFAFFAVWTFLFGLVRAVRIKDTPNLWVVFILSLSFGLLIEFLQFVFPTNRSPELFDFIADALGSAAAVITLRFIFKRGSIK